jgi:hypothetical protein
MTHWESAAVTHRESGAMTHRESAAMTHRESAAVKVSGGSSGHLHEQVVAFGLDGIHRDVLVGGG